MTHAEKIKRRDDGFHKLNDENKEAVMNFTLDLLIEQNGTNQEPQKMTREENRG